MRISRMRLTTACPYRRPKRAFRTACELALGWLAVDEEFAFRRKCIRCARAIRSLFLSDYEEKVDAIFTRLHESLGGNHHCGCDSFRVTCATTGELVLREFRRDVRWNRVEMCRERDTAAGLRCPHIPSSLRNFLDGDIPSSRNEPF